MSTIVYRKASLEFMNKIEQCNPTLPNLLLKSLQNPYHFVSIGTYLTCVKDHIKLQ